MYGVYDDCWVPGNRQLFPPKDGKITEIRAKNIKNQINSIKPIDDRSSTIYKV